jgi:NADH:ubiquinone oxidoreductase subunit 2 (subunit N)
MLTLWHNGLWSMSASSQSGGVLLLYIIGYAVLVIALSFVLSAAGSERSGGADGGALFVRLGQARLRWLTIAVVLSMAGLPPLFFFGCKLGLLGLLLRAGSWYHLVLVGSLLLLS